MDPRTVFITITLFMLLSGGMLGLMHTSFTPEDRPAAKDWRIGTLLVAAGSILLAVQDMAGRAVQTELLIVLGNALNMIGLTLFWRAIRRFAHKPDNARLFLVPLIATACNAWFTFVMPSFDMRVILAGLFWSCMFLAAAHTLLRHYKLESFVSVRVLAITCLLPSVLGLARSAAFALHSGSGASSVLDTGHVLILLTTFAIALLPIIGTTAFLLMCFERVHKKAESAAATDYLTGLPNRRSISTVIEARFKHAKRSSSSALAVAAIDIDHFKSINDQYGHDVGDQALQHVAQVLAEQCRSGAHQIGRHGGEEFVAVFEVADQAEAVTAAERLRQAIEAQPLRYTSGSLSMTVSIGVGALQANDDRFDDLLQRADRALYSAKAKGRNRVAALLRRCFRSLGKTLYSCRYNHNRTYFIWAIMMIIIPVYWIRPILWGNQ